MAEIVASIQLAPVVDLQTLMCHRGKQARIRISPSAISLKPDWPMYTAREKSSNTLSEVILMIEITSYHSFVLFNLFCIYIYIMKSPVGFDV